MKPSSFTSLAVSLLLLTSPALSAETDSESDFGISFTLGVRPGGEEASHHLTNQNSTIITSISYGLGLHYRSISLLGSARLIFSAEVSYLNLDTDEVVLSYSGTTFQGLGYIVPMVLWAEVWPKGRFGPFARIGLGAGWVDYTDECSNDEIFSPHFQYWSFVYGMGAGIYYSPGEKIDILFIIQGIAVTSESTVDGGYQGEFTVGAPWETGSIGVTFRYWL